MVYTVCSLEREEGENRVQGLLSRNQAAEQVAVDAATEGLPETFVTDDGYLRSLPCHLADVGGVDGFFAARIRRRE